MQGDAGRHAGVERLGLRGDGDPHQHVAALGHQPGQAAPLRADHQHEGSVSHAQVAEVGVAPGVEAGHEQPGLLVGGERADQVGGPGDRHPGQRPGRRLPGSRAHVRRTAGGHQHAVTAERRDRADDGAEVTRVGDSVQRHDQRFLAAGPGALQQVVGVGVVVRPDLQGQALVHRAAGQPVQFGPARLDHRDPHVGGEPDHLVEPRVGAVPGAGVERGGGDAGAQRLQHRVAAGHHLGSVAGAAGRGPPPGPSRPLGPATPVRGVRRAVCRRRRAPRPARPAAFAAARRCAGWPGRRCAGGVGPLPSSLCLP